jgi:hypothetical protein
VKRNETQRNVEWTGADCDPSWGPVGSLLKEKDPTQYAHILPQHESMLALERSRKLADAQSDAEAETDETHGETRICPQCQVAFQPRFNRHRFCTSRCRLQWFRARKPAA